MIHLAVDLGYRRIGFAICDEGEIIASPLKTVAVDSQAAAEEAVLTVVQETDAAMIVIGYPRNMSGRPGKKAKEAVAFAERLEAKGLSVVLCDERLTTVEAERALKEADVSRRVRKKYVDALAAQRILYTYLAGRTR